MGPRGGHLVPEPAAALIEPGFQATANPGCRVAYLVFDLIHRPRVMPQTQTQRPFKSIGMVTRDPQPSWEAVFGHPQPVVVPEELQRSVRTLVLDLTEEYWVDALSMLTANHHLEAWLLGYERFLAHPERPPGPRDPVSRAEAIIHRHLQDRLTAAQVAERCGLSLSQLNRRFQARRGISVREAIQRQREAVLPGRLAEKGRTLAEAARATGFGSASALCTWCRRRTGLSPREWFRQRRQADLI